MTKSTEPLQCVVIEVVRHARTTKDVTIEVLWYKCTLNNDMYKLRSFNLPRCNNQEW